MSARPHSAPQAWDLFRSVFGFEVRYQLRSPLFAGVAAVFFVLAFFAMASESVQVGERDASLWLNASHSILTTQYVFSIVAMFAAVAFAGTPMIRDADFRMQEVLLSTRVRSLPFFLGRFVASYLAALGAASMAIAGTLVGAFMPWLDAERLGAFNAEPYVHALFTVMVPNVFMQCALFFSLVAWLRSNMAAYMGALALVMFYAVVGAYTDPANLHTMALFDPFGAAGFDLASRYLTVFEKNTSIPALTAAVLWSRFVWVGLAAALLAAVCLRFDLRARPALTGARLRMFARRGVVAAEVSPVSPAPMPARRFVRPIGAHGARTGRMAIAWGAFRSQVAIDLRYVFASPPFLILTLFAIVNALGSITGTLAQAFGTPVHPITGPIVDALRGSTSISLLLVISYYAGELVHRERVHRIRDIVDASPAPAGAIVLSKIATLIVVIAALVGVGMLIGIAVQLAHGYTRLQLDVYLIGLSLGFALEFMLWAVLAVFLQVLTNNKFVGMLAFVVVFFGLAVLSSLGYQHVLYSYGMPQLPYSDMNGFGHYIRPFLVLFAYWLCFAGLLGIGAHLGWPRGLAGSFRARVGEARARLRGGVRWAAMACTAAFIGLGGYIFYNTNIVTQYVDRDEVQLRQADYEKQFARFEWAPQPAMTDADLQVDIDPTDRAVRTRGTLQWTNAGPAPVRTLYVNVPADLRVLQLDIPGASPHSIDRRLGYHIYNLQRPLLPGQSLRVRFDFDWRNPGFNFVSPNNLIVENGTFFDSIAVLPYLGFDRTRILLDNAKRREHGLPPPQRMARIDDARALRHTFFGTTQRSQFHVVLSTRSDQTAIAPGYLQRTWQKEGRRFFEYRMDKPIWPFFSFSSARYSMRKGDWSGVPLEVYYHAPHDWNINGMLAGSRDALAYFSKVFAPYQYRQFRILEFPSYRTFAQSFPNTIPFSEGIGFVADLTDDEHIDYVYYVTAHEAAHQWWGHQLAPAGVQGQSMIVESLAQYSSLMMMERRFGRARMRRFLKYELDRYLRRRGGELLEELPLALVEDQDYIHYAKGSLALYALCDYLGEDAVNRALSRFLLRWRDAPPPFATTSDLIAEFRREAPASLQPLLTDLFQKIVLYDLKATGATATKRADGRFDVLLKFEAHKFEATGNGEEREVPLALVMAAGVFGTDAPKIHDDLPRMLALQRVRVRSGQNSVRFIAPEMPGQAGIDPLNVLIDRRPEDNLVDVN